MTTKSLKGSIFSGRNPLGYKLNTIISFDKLKDFGYIDILENMGIETSFDEKSLDMFSMGLRIPSFIEHHMLHYSKYAYLSDKLTFIWTIYQYKWNYPNFNFFDELTANDISKFSYDYVRHYPMNLINFKDSYVIANYDDKYMINNRAPFVIDTDNLLLNDKDIESYLSLITGIPEYQLIIPTLNTDMEYIKAYWLKNNLDCNTAYFTPNDYVKFFILYIEALMDNPVVYHYLMGEKSIRDVNKIACEYNIDEFKNKLTEHYDYFNGLIMIPSKKCESIATVNAITNEEPKPLKISKVNNANNNNDPSDFVSIANKQIELYKKKNMDYGNATDKLFKKHGFIYYQIMLEQKMQRIDSITNNNKEHNFESLEDSLLDLSNYALLAVESLRKEKQGK